MSRYSPQRGLSAVTLKKEGPPTQGVLRRGLEALGNFADDAAGDVAMIFGLMAMVMFVLVGAAVDMGRWLNAREQTLAAIDSAVLAAGRALQTNGGDATKAIAVANQYYAQNTKTRLSVTNDTVHFTVTDAGTSVTATGSAIIKTPFIGLLDIVSHKYATLPLLNLSGGEPSKATLAVGGNAELNLEISMMLDTSGSMAESTSSGNQKYIDMRAAASDLVNIVVWADQGTYKSRVAIAPFSGDVRLPGEILGKVNDPSAPSSIVLSSGNKSYTYKKTPCVAERMGSNKHTDAAPGIGDYIPYEYTSDGKCAQDQSSDELMALSNNKGNLLAKIAGLEPRGRTAGHIGTAWAYYLLSPKWATYLPSNSQPASYSDTKTKKIAILMTDGEYNSTHDVNGVPTEAKGAGGSSNGNASSGQAIAICNQMRQSGLDVYTVGFNMSQASSTAVNTLKNCASDSSKYYDAENGEQLKQAFRDIALKISTLYLSK